MQSEIDIYEVLKDLGKEIFKESDVVKTGKVSSRDIEKAKEFHAKAITATNPEVLSLYFEHVMTAPELGKRLAQQYSSSERSESRSSRQARIINVDEIEFLLWLHEIGRLVDPAGYLRNDLIEERLLKDFGIPQRLIDEMPPIETMLKVVKMLDLNEKQIIGEERLSSEQEKIASDYFNLLRPTQRLIFFADNFGKRDVTGKLFDFNIFINYLRTYSENYPESEFTEDIRKSIILTIFIIEKIIEWFKQLGIEYEIILKELQDYGPKFVIVARHGDLFNPSGLIYNTDTVMKKFHKEVIHLSPKGIEQMKRLGELIKKRRFRIRKLISSPSIRAVESSNNLNSILGISHLQTSDELDDVYMPGPVAEGMTMKEHQKQGGGSVYVDSRWAKYDHETPAEIIKRLENTFWNVLRSLIPGETVILISHGDPVAWWINHKVTGEIPDPKNLRNLIYPNKGDAIVAIIDPEGKWFSHYLLKDPSLIEGESY